MFDLEDAIRQWKKALAANPGLEDGQRAELETCLRDEIADLVRRGLSPEEAFRQVSTEMGNAEEIGAEFFKVYAKRRFGPPSWRRTGFTPALVWNYIIIALRRIKRQKGFSFINMTGLALGMAACFFLVLWVQDERSFDRFHKNAASIFRVDINWGTNRLALTPYPLGPAVEQNIPEVKSTARQASLGTVVLRAGEKTFFENRTQAVDPSFLQIFSFPLLQGDPESALSQTYSMIMTESLARKYFGSENPIGKTVTMDGQFDFMVAGIIKDVPANSTIQYDLLVPLEFMRDFGWYIDLWGSINVTTWVELRDRGLVEAVRKKISDLYRTQLEPPPPEPILVGLKTINLRASARPGQTSQKIQTVYLFSGLAAAILLIACINFMNLSTARSSKRALEVGLRKVVGASRRDLIGQFYGESLLVAGIALVLALGLVLVLLPSFNTLAGKSLTARSLLRVEYLLVFLGVAFATGLLSGSYPALFLSSFRPVKVLNGTLRAGSNSGLIRKALIVTQFGLAVIVLVGMLVVLKQMDYLRSKNIGYDKDQLIYLSLQGETQRNFSLFRERLLRETNVSGVTGIFQWPTMLSSRTMDADWEGRDPEQELTIYYSSVDPHYIETMKIEMAQGRPFSAELTGDFADEALINRSMARAVPDKYIANPANAFLINEELGRRMGGGDQVGKRLRLMGIDGIIIGVMKDFHFQTIQRKIEPLALFTSPTHVRFAVIRLPKGNIRASLAEVRATWERIFSLYPFEYRFYDEDFGQMFLSEQRMATLLQWAAALAMTIACLGLFGLASFLAEQRTREIGIRKTLGATSAGIALMLTKEFLRWIFLANLIAGPVAYWIAARWLRGYAYHISLGASVFVLALTATLGVAILTISRQTLKTAWINPARCIRYE
jgi:putative ABC transport system permease protein